MKRLIDWMMDFIIAAFLLGFGGGFWVLLLVLAVAYARAADPLPVDAVVLQEITYAESAEDVLERGETVAVFDELDDSTAATLRVGDGTRAGGRTVTDPWGVRATTTRTLAAGEYALVPGGATVYTNGAWQLLPARTGTEGTSRTGTLQIVSMHTISAIAYETDISNGAISITPASQSAGITNAVILAREDSDNLFPVAVTFSAAISNLSISAYCAPHLLGATNDFRNATLFVRDASSGFPSSGGSALSDFEPIPKSWFQRETADNLGEDWWRHTAGGDVRMNRRDVYWSSTIREITGERTRKWIYRTDSGIDREIMSASFGGSTDSGTNQTYSILAAELDADPLSLWISATLDFDSAPTIQHVGSLTSGDPWTNCTTTTDWPETTDITVAGETRTTYLLQCANPGGGFFRVSGDVDSEAAASDYIEFGVADLRNSGTITAGRGFRVASPPGGTNYVAGVTTNIAVSIPGGGTSTWSFVGGILIDVE